MRAVLVVLALLLSGCADSTNAPFEGAGLEGEGAGTNETVPPELQYDPGFISDKGELIQSGDELLLCTNAAESLVQLDDPANKTFDGSAHVHDEWQGQDTATIFDERPQLNLNNFFQTPGAVVFPGAGKATFTLSWDATDYPGGRWLSVDYMPGAAPGRAYGMDQALHFTESGQSITIEFNTTSNDPAHAAETKWRFRMDPDTPARATVHDAAGSGQTGHLVHDYPWAAGTVTRPYGAGVDPWQTAHLTWEIERTYDCLPIDPPHIDIWAGTDILVMGDGTSDESASGNIAMKSGTIQPASRAGILQANRTVAPGAALVRVTVDVANEAAVGADFDLEFVTPEEDPSAYGTTWFTPEPVVDDGPAHRVYDIEVLPGQHDSPYVVYSHWDFRLAGKPASTDPAQAWEMDGTVTWLIEVFARGAEIPAP